MNEQDVKRADFRAALQADAAAGDGSSDSEGTKDAVGRKRRLGMGDAARVTFSRASSVDWFEDGGGGSPPPPLAESEGDDESRRSDSEEDSIRKLAEELRSRKKKRDKPSTGTPPRKKKKPAAAAADATDSKQFEAKAAGSRPASGAAAAAAAAAAASSSSSSSGGSHRRPLREMLREDGSSPSDAAPQVAAAAAAAAGAAAGAGGMSEEEKRVYEMNNPDGLAAAAAANNIQLPLLDGTQKFVPYPGVTYHGRALTADEKKKQAIEDKQCFRCLFGQDPELKTENEAYDAIANKFTELFGRMTNIALGETLHAIFMAKIGKKMGIDWPAGCIMRHFLEHEQVLDSSVDKRIVGGTLGFMLRKLAARGCFVENESTGEIEVHNKNADLYLKIVKVRFGIRIN